MARLFAPPFSFILIEALGSADHDCAVSFPYDVARGPADLLGHCVEFVRPPGVLVPRDVIVSMGVETMELDCVRLASRSHTIQVPDPGKPSSRGFVFQVWLGFSFFFDRIPLDFLLAYCLFWV